MLLVPVLVLAVAANGVTVSGLALGAALLALGLMTLVIFLLGSAGLVSVGRLVG